MDDQEVIEQFYTLISWKDKCQEIKYGDRIFVKTDSVIRVPTYYGEYGDGIDLAVAVASEFKIKPYLLLWGNAPQEMVEGIWWDSHTITPHVYIGWVPPYYNQMLWSDAMTVKALDGIDWQRSLESIAKGGTEPVWSWENGNQG